MKRTVLTVAAVIGLGAAGAAAVAFSRFDPDSYKPDIVAAVKRATGRDLALNGRIGLKLSLTPTVQVADVAFANPAGFSRPQMATVQAIEIQFALLPLISGRLQIERLLLVKPDIVLETNASGRPNWQMDRPPPAPAGPPGPATPGRRSATVSIDTVRIQDGTVAYLDGATGRTTALGLPKLDATADSADSPAHVDMDAVYHGTAFNLVADTGPLSRLHNPADASAWPVKLALTVAGARLAADGTLTRPLRARGYDLAVSGTVPDLLALAPLLPSLPLPLHDVSFAAKLADKDGNWPDVSALTLHVGASDLGGFVPGLTLSRLDVDAPATGQTFKAGADGQFDNAPLSLAATLGPLALLLPGAAPAPFPVDVALRAAGADIAVKGSLADARAMTGADLAVTATVPDLAALSPLARTRLPPLRQVAFKGTVTDAAGGFGNGAALHGFSLSGPDGDLSGDAALTLRPRKALTATLKSSRLDLDAAERTDPPPPGPPSQAVARTAPPPKRTDRIFSDWPIPFDRLRDADADIRMDIGTLHVLAADSTSVAFRALLKDGKLDVDPFAADLPGGRATGTLSVAAGQPAPVHLTLHAPGLPLKALLAAAHQPPVASGNLEVLADLSGAGDTPHAIAASLDGSLGLAVAGGAIDNRLMGSLLGRVAEAVNVLNLVGKGGTSELRCFAARLDARRGTASVQPLVLGSSLLTMTGSGSIDFATETLDLTLRPQVRVAGTSLVLPVKVRGQIRDPAAAVDRLGAAESNAGKVAGAVIGDATGIGLLGGLLAGGRVGGGKDADPCPAALAEARGQPAPAAKPDEPVLSDPEAALKNLFR